MPFSVANFNRELQRDNPKYERFVTSDLHELVTLVRGASDSWTAADVADRMKRIPRAKWTKYARTHAYLLQQVPGLRLALRAVPTNFATVSMTSEMNNTVLRHIMSWQSDTGNVGDLASAFTRENITWPQWPAALTACIGDEMAPYRQSGSHTGLAANPANLGRGQDDHSVLGPFNQNIFNYTGPAVSASMTQFYEYSYDRANWHRIAGSGYTITREVSRVGEKVQIRITKSSTSRPRDTFSVTKVL